VEQEVVPVLASVVVLVVVGLPQAAACVTLWWLVLVLCWFVLMLCWLVLDLSLWSR
jgi:hypothetical protein